MTRRRAVVAMSGGVDSSVAAALLVEEGYDVTGIMLKLWRGDEINHASGCCNLGAAEDARRVADVLEIPFYVLNFADRFEETVVRNFKDDYLSGRTPNPCVRCNQWIKFDMLWNRAETFGAEVLATGHYARTREHNGRFRLLRGMDPEKDQSYVLWMLRQEQLRSCMFPVGGMTKAETRARAEQLGLRTARKPDSQEICFVRNGDFDAYVSENLGPASEPGPVLDASGRVVGRHRGIGRYTVGQRKGLGVSLGVPVFVSSIDAESNSIVVGTRGDLEVSGFDASEVVWGAERPDDGLRVLVQHRAHGEVHEAVLRLRGDDRFEVGYLNPVSAVAPGQSAALYSKDDPNLLLGGGVIESTVPARAAV